ncbi:2-oxoacid:acceptor oxidoreductase, gamma subunit, pyruvate/2-ketoisovalerate family/2-oxoacid:acceptor oxidoreductase, delta subunit, pyruvate/2-ketoisovalerate family [Archaeoglobus sulfaticallidus PM70-1]|uniref:pyruvate synthase n=1 Tax=Archaeoglobus sulfaticallidus PM70-1 TaxID=387631 RepID=N0BCZ7_9EURY|nr:2-oxoacid:acceptor oxidoreductase family protein [Archaeoglobus sulfaticallidus]AGK60888.1 2-oxoacid:acceptor oxidoreductase, gamma subunit, pyruvate/2-ketoisovalerate family/2-oxoacid:acceptor oxidoreductase, delta subunit, pyruvate/2-ketoisovalerate family [Archaeoglobus sulfaticallidus PM70-1]
MYLEIRIHGRGGQGVVTASKLIAEAAYLDGYYSQSMPFFGAERRGAPVVSFARISDEPIYRTSQVYEPDVVVIFDPVLINFPHVFSGLKEDGVVVVNSRDFLDARNIVMVDADGIAEKYDLVVAGMPVYNIPMLGALSHVVIYDSMRYVIERKFGEKALLAFDEAYMSASRVSGRDLRFDRVDSDLREIGRCEIPVSTPSVGVAGKTGLWRIVRPVVDRERCNECGTCSLYCPEGVISVVLGMVDIDYEYCKGCMICMSVCPKRAISGVKESEVKEYVRSS